jgi:hypothetical protein
MKGQMTMKKTRSVSKTFLQGNFFSKVWDRLGLGDDALRTLEVAIMAGPDANPVVRGTGGLRKIRFAEPGSNKGKSGAYRVGYVSFPKHGVVLLVTAWGKNEKTDLTAADRKAVAKMIADAESLLEQGKT